MVSESIFTRFEKPSIFKCSQIRIIYSFHFSTSVGCGMNILPFFTVRLSCRTAGGREILHMVSVPLSFSWFPLYTYTALSTCIYTPLKKRERVREKEKKWNTRVMIVCLCVCCPHLLLVLWRKHRLRVKKCNCCHYINASIGLALPFSLVRIAWGVFHNFISRDLFLKE